MPTARELLEQTDAMMRRNRARELESDIPELTDKVAVAAPATPLREPPRAQAPLSSPRHRSAGYDDVPELVDAVEELSIQPLPDEGEVSRWLEVDLGEVSITGEAPDTLAVVPPATLHSPPPAPKDESAPGAAAANPPPSVPVTASALLAARVAGTLSGRPAEPPPASDPGFDAMLGMVPAPATIPAPEAPSGPEDDRLKGLAEEIRMQVLQRIDIFTDTGLHGELAARLQPIVDRASADLVTTINREVGQILRAYVAEAIEREIEKWREENP